MASMVVMVVTMVMVTMAMVMVMMVLMVDAWAEVVSCPTTRIAGDLEIVMRTIQPPGISHPIGQLTQLQQSDFYTAVLERFKRIIAN